MSPLSPSSLPSRASPKSYTSNPYLNQFSALSPELDAQVGNVNAASAVQTKRPRVRYSRSKLLKIAKQCEKKGWQRPQGMGALDTWFGPSSPTKAFSHPQMEDPAIASIGIPGSSRRGGFGEGFGYGGGIGGGKALGKGGRNIGLRRNDADGESKNGFAQMGRFSVKMPEKIQVGGRRREESERVKGEGRGEGGRREDVRRDDGEWRRDKPAPRDPKRWNARPADDNIEPAWMDDEPTIVDPAIVETSNDDSLIQFVPGEDMIAAHKRAMRERETGEWRGKPLAPFFGDPAAVPPGLPPKNKVFNSADYLRPTKAQPEEVDESPTGAFSSRFQKFFGNANDPVPPVEPRDTTPVDDRMAKLLGALSTKPAYQPPPEHHAFPPAARAPASDPRDRLSFGPQGFRPPHEHAYLNQPRPHMSIPPGMFPRPPQYLPVPPRRDGGISPQDLLRDLQMPQRSPNPPYPSQPYPPPNPYPSQAYPPHFPFPRPPQQPYDSRSHQQDMLATLFAGLPGGPPRQ